MSKDWLRYHFETEKYYASRLLALPKNSAERVKLFEEGYERIKEITDCYNPGLSETDHLSFLPDIIKELAPISSRVFDIGCASGNLVEALNILGYYASGIDVSLDYINESKQKLKKMNKDHLVEHGDIQYYTTDNKYDFIIMDNVLEHVYPDCVSNVLNKCYNMLNKVGYIMIITPHKFSGPHDISYHFVPLGSKSQGFHFREYSFSEVYEMLKSAGFQQVLGFPLYPGYYPRLGRRPSLWAAEKARFFEKVAQMPLFAKALKVNRRLTVRVVATLFPCMCLGVKNEVR